MVSLEKFFNRRDPFLIQFSLLTLVGFWYVDSERKWVRATYAVYKFVAVFLLTSLLFFEIIDISTNDQALSKLAERLCAAAVTCIVTTRTYLMLHHTDILYSLQEKLTQFRELKSGNPGHLEILQKASDKIVTDAKVFYSVAVAAIFFWSIHPTLYEDRKLPIPVTLPVDMEKFPNYELLYLYVTIILVMFTVSVVAAVLGFSSYLTLINAQFEIVRTNIENIASEREDVARRNRFWSEFNTGRNVRGMREEEEKRIQDAKTMETLKDVIQTQNFIYGEVDIFKRLHSEHLLVHILGIIFGVAVVETTGVTDAFTVHLTKRLLILGVAVLDIFSICHFGEELQYKSCEIAEALYMIPWHEMDVALQKVVLLMSVRSRRPCILKAGGTIRINLATYLNIIRVAYNFVLLLRHTVIRTA